MQPWESDDWLQFAQVWLNQQFPTASRIEPVTVWAGAFCGVSSVNGRRLHFKALPPELSLEVALTSLLRSFSSFILEVAAVHLEKRWLLTWSAGETPLIAESNPEPWLQTLRGLARLQIKTLPHLELLRSTGCETLEPAVALRGAREVLRHSSHAEAPAAFAHLEKINLEPLHALPIALAHGDFHPMNFIAPSYIIDWSDALITHPFADLERFLRWIMGSKDKAHPWSTLENTLSLEPLFIDAYLEPWSAFAPLEKLRESFRLTRPIGLTMPLVRNASLDTDRGRGLEAWFTKLLART